MRRFGSYINRMLEEAAGPEPEVGMGATELCWTDRHAGTIIEVVRATKGPNAGKAIRVSVQRDHAHRDDGGGPSDSQSYVYAPDPKGRVTDYSLRRNGRWIIAGGSMAGGDGLIIGRRDEYYDYSF